MGWIHAWGSTWTLILTYPVHGLWWRRLANHHLRWQNSFCWDHTQFQHQPSREYHMCGIHINPTKNHGKSLLSRTVWTWDLALRPGQSSHVICSSSIHYCWGPERLHKEDFFPLMLLKWNCATWDVEIKIEISKTGEASPLNKIDEAMQMRWLFHPSGCQEVIKWSIPSCLTCLVKRMAVS